MMKASRKGCLYYCNGMYLNADTVIFCARQYIVGERLTAACALINRLQDFYNNSVILLQIACKSITNTLSRCYGILVTLLQTTCNFFAYRV